jgi:hypothetical protein
MSGDAVPMNPMYKTLLDPKAPVLSGPSRAELRKQASTVSAEPPQLTKGKHSKIGGARKTRRVGKGRGDIVLTLMAIRDQIKVYHWQTSKYARHIATNDLVASLDKNIDEFVEVYMGKYGRPKITKTIKLHNFSESAARAFVAKQTEFLTKKMPAMLKSTDSDLLNIRDTILADVNKTLYLFTLR